jgi:hypothetical protein
VPSPIPEQCPVNTRNQHSSRPPNQRFFTLRNQRDPPTNTTPVYFQTLTRPPPVLNGAWGSFATVIKKDDKNLLAKAKEEREREQKAGIRYMPEIKETYKGKGSESVVAMKEGNDGRGSLGGIKLETGM